jgi:hypothetical protein
MHCLIGIMQMLVQRAEAVVVPLMTREAFAAAIGVPVGVLTAQCDRGYWPQVTIGKRVFINVEAVRLRAVERAGEYTLPG